LKVSSWFLPLVVVSLNLESSVLYSFIKASLPSFLLPKLLVLCKDYSLHLVSVPHAYVLIIYEPLVGISGVGKMKRRTSGTVNC
jgi:hypothetical protein